MRYSVVGLGKLGASMAAAIASRGHTVVGVDTDDWAVAQVNAGRSPVDETGVDAVIAANSTRLRATTSHHDAVLASDLTFVVVPTPSDARGAFSLEHAAAAFHEIGCGLAEKTDYHTVVLTSTVLPGSTRQGLLPVLEAASGREAGRDFGVCYAPEFIALGSVIRDFLNPDFTLIGELDERSGHTLQESYASIMVNDAPSRRMSLENAELTKISLNAYVTTKITFANMLAEICERVPGGDVDVVTDALGLDRRIGRAYLTGALGYGGPCFPRDNLALSFFAHAVGTRAELAEATERSNRASAGRAARRVCELIGEGTKVAVLGLAYKPSTPVIEASQGVQLARELARAGAEVVAHDPLAGHLARAALDGDVRVLDSVRECLAGAEVVLITNPDPVYRSLSAPDFDEALPLVTVVDYWRILDRAIGEAPNIRYVAFGRAAEDAPAIQEQLAALWEVATLQVAS